MIKVILKISFLYPRGAEPGSFPVTLSHRRVWLGNNRNWDGPPEAVEGSPSAHESWERAKVLVPVTGPRRAAG